jgi:hypothetical protein
MRRAVDSLDAAAWARNALVAAMIVASAANDSLAARPEVQFDAASLIAAEDVTTADFRAANPGEKLIVVRIDISSFVRRGDANDLAELVYRVEATDREMLVFDFAPKTTFAPLAEGRVTVERDTDTKTSVKANAAARYFPFAEGDAAFDHQVNEQTRLRYELPAPQEVVVTSGSIERRRGVFVKLRASRRGSLEGAKAIAVMFVVPQNWRGGVLHIAAEARSNVGGVLGRDGESAISGTASLAAGVYVSGDLVARDAVERVMATEKAWTIAEAEHPKSRTKDFSQHVARAFDDVLSFGKSKSRSERAVIEQAKADVSLAARRATRDSAAQQLVELNAAPRE